MKKTSRYLSALVVVAGVLFITNAFSKAAPIAATFVALDPQEELFKDRFDPRTTSTEWGSGTITPSDYAYHALAAIYGWKRQQMGHDFGTTFGTNAVDLQTAAIYAADEIADLVQTAGWGIDGEQENGFQTGMAAWALIEVGGILLEYNTETTKATAYLDLADTRLSSTSNGYKEKGGYRCGQLDGVNYDHDTYSSWNGCGNGTTVFCSYWSIYDPISGNTCTSGRRWIKNRNVLMGVDSLAYDKYRTSATTHRERGVRAIRSHAQEIGTSGTANTDYYGEADALYGTKPWDDHNWAEVTWMLHAGELISGFDSTMGTDRMDRADGHYLYIRANISSFGYSASTEAERKARSGCHFARRDTTAWDDCYDFYIARSSISDPAAYGLVLDGQL